MEKLLIICDDYWHPGEIIEKGLAFLADEYDIDIVHDAKDTLTPEMLRRYPVILCAKCDEINAANTNAWFEPEVTEVQVEDLAQYVAEGHGYLSLHSGNSFFVEKNPKYCEFIGCSFVRHPRRCTVHVKATGEHPITAGTKPFAIRDEHYECDHYKEDMEVILESTSETGGTQVAGFVNTLGQGRLCSLMPGHNLSVFEDEEYQKIIRQAIKWCAGKI